MRLPPLHEGVLLRRYKRFLADVRLASGEEITAHVPNTGSLLTCIEPGRPVWVHDTGNEERKYRHSWVLVKPKRSLVCVDTGIPNRVVYDFAVAQKIPELAGYREYLREVPYGENSRADMCCRVHVDDMLRRAWVEVKSTTLMRDGVAYFPDAVTSRGLKHLVELTRAVREGDRAVQVFFVQRGDCSEFKPADDIDPDYGAELRRAVSAGVTAIALQAKVTKHSITIKRPIPVVL